MWRHIIYFSFCHIQTRINNLGIIQRIVPCGNLTRYSLQGSQLPSHRINSAVKILNVILIKYKYSSRNTRSYVWYKIFKNIIRTDRNIQHLTGPLKSQMFRYIGGIKYGITNITLSNRFPRQLRSEYVHLPTLTESFQSTTFRVTPKSITQCINPVWDRK